MLYTRNSSPLPVLVSIFGRGEEFPITNLTNYKQASQNDRDLVVDPAEIARPVAVAFPYLGMVQIA